LGISADIISEKKPKMGLRKKEKNVKEKGRKKKEK
jgi:hypothetical protein